MAYGYLALVKARLRRVAPFQVTLIGAAVTLTAARAAAGMLAGIGPADPVAFGAAALFLGLVALIACLQPARRATRIDAVDALRCQ